MSETVSQTVSSESTLTCTKCQRSFTLRSSFSYHQRHSKTCGTARDTCLVCNKSFATVDLFQKHLQSAMHLKKVNVTKDHHTALQVSKTINQASEPMNGLMADLCNKIFQLSTAGSTMNTQVTGNNNTVQVNNTINLNCIAIVPDSAFLTPEGIAASLNDHITDANVAQGQQGAVDLVMNQCLTDPVTQQLRVFVKNPEGKSLLLRTSQGIVSMPVKFLRQNYKDGMKIINKRKMTELSEATEKSLQAYQKLCDTESQNEVIRTANDLLPPAQIDIIDEMIDKVKATNFKNTFFSPLKQFDTDILCKVYSRMIKESSKVVEEQ